jgi:hypothetical protein
MYSYYILAFIVIMVLYIVYSIEFNNLGSRVKRIADVSFFGPTRSYYKYNML